MTEIRDLAQARFRVLKFLAPQRQTIGHFWDDEAGVFFRTSADRDEALEASSEPRDVDRAKVHRLTSTVTCLESLLESPDWFRKDESPWPNSRARETLQDFMLRSLSTQEGWKSDDAAWVYCRTRTLGGALRLLQPPERDWSDEQKQNAASLLEQAWTSSFRPGGSFGLREATEDPRFNTGIGEETSSQQYPANAFLTYWGLLAASLSDGLPIEPEGPTSHAAREAAKDWLIQNLATQVALHYAQSAQADPQQLAWSICGLVRFGDASTLSTRTTTHHQLLAAGIDAFFQQQNRGTWAVGAPLFHYRNAGNAYAYTYETLAELLSLATSAEIDQRVAETLSFQLRRYGDELLSALEYADQTGQWLTDDVRTWTSGHHPHRTTSESWATASVYRFGQALRRLVGSWSAAEAKVALGARRADADLDTLRERGATWNLGPGATGPFLATAFVHPILRARAKDQDSRFLPDPDQQLLSSGDARSAMLFGPPGTSKTKMVESVAGAIGWDFVEITPAQFLDHGVDQVSHRADEIFRHMMELDRCVVLLDEIDELIRSRSDEPDALSRFFTTTMLPRLAKLWEAGRVLFFVNTNNILGVDPAIARSQRFDAALLVLPPGESVKCQMLKAEGVQLDFSMDLVTEDCNGAGKVPDKGIGWLALVRHDQVGALAEEVKKKHPSDSPKSLSEVRDGLVRLSRELSSLDWRQERLTVENGGLAPLPDLTKYVEAARKDSRVALWGRLDKAVETSDVPDHWQVEGAEGGIQWVSMGTPESPEAWAKEHGADLTTDGIVSPHPSNH